MRFLRGVDAADHKGRICRNHGPKRKWKSTLLMYLLCQTRYRRDHAGWKTLNEYKVKDSAKHWQCLAHYYNYEIFSTGNCNDGKELLIRENHGTG